MDLEIAVRARDVYGKKNKRLRSTGVVPGVLFGKTIGSIPVQLDAKDLEQLYHQAGRTSVVKVSVDGGQPTSAIIKSVQRNPLSGRALHVDLFALDLTHEMQADIPLLFTGSSAAVEMESAILLTSLDHLKVRALPADLPHEITVDLSALVDMDATIHVRDLRVEGPVTVINDPDELVAKVTPPREEEVIEVPAEELEEGAVEGEAAEGEEGAAAAEGAGSGEGAGAAPAEDEG
jgi:large subunit ribosomal protein L25